jgi:NAD(P)-dependent dehydrogenase (short-subunit alcohol dehydrogenase family)
MKLLQDKVCLVTGAAGSIGLATSEHLLREGGRVMLVDRDAAGLAAARAALAAPSADLDTIAADVADPAPMRECVARAAARWGRIDVLFANAGVSGVVRPVTEYPEDVFDAVMAVNVRAPFLACKYALPQMNDGGSIILTASVVGVTSDPGICAYAASKHAVIGLMRTVAKEAAARRIRVNAIAPGPLDNGFQQDIERGLSAAIGRDAGALLDSLIPLNRHGRAAEIARAVVFLASDQSSFTTGAVLMADGGMHI